MITLTFQFGNQFETITYNKPNKKRAETFAEWYANRYKAKSYWIN